jgi:hypothetical protein
MTNREKERRRKEEDTHMIIFEINCGQRRYRFIRTIHLDRNLLVPKMSCPEAHLLLTE